MTRWNVDQISKELGINPATLWRWRKSGKFPEPAEKVGREYLWRQDQIDQFLSKNSRSKAEMQIDDFDAFCIRRLDKSISDYDSGAAYTEETLMNLRLWSLKSFRDLLSKALEIPASSSLEDIYSEIVSLKRKESNMKKILS